MRITSLKYNLRVALCILCVGLCSIGIYAQETQTDIDFLKQFQQGLEKGPIGEAIKVMKDSAGINVYLVFHIADDSALWPYVLELYFDVRAKRKEPYLHRRLFPAVMRSPAAKFRATFALQTKELK